MKVSVDCGNTLMKAGIFDNNKQIVKVAKFESGKWKDLLTWLNNYKIDKIGLSSVVNIPDEFERSMKKRASGYFVFDHYTKLPFEIRYKTPDTLGKDRIALIAGAIDRTYTSPLLVVNTGSCITYNFLDASNQFTGGAISPGLTMRFNALEHFTHALPGLSPAEEVPCPGADTNENIQCGVVKGTAYEIESFFHSYSEKFPGLNCVLSGGDAPYLSRFLNIVPHTEPELTLYGINKIMEYNDH